MRIEIPFGNEVKVLQVDLPPANVVVVQSKNPPGSGPWAKVVAEGLAQPFDATPIRQEKLRGKQVVVITDDWGRPTPASEAIPAILEELAAAGAEDEKITFVTASGMHDPMSEEEMVRKLGKRTVAKYRCISHDGGDRDNLVLVGITPQGTPMWLNRQVVEADYRVSLGRIYLHPCHGYEGGYKALVPGVASFETVTRDHSFNYSATSTFGVHDNPSRAETDAVGELLPLDFVINVVVNARAEPVKAFCGHPLIAHRWGIEFGDREVWSAKAPGMADIVVASPGPSGAGAGVFETKVTVLDHAVRITKESGTIICVSAEEGPFQPPQAESAADDALLNGPRERFDAAVPSLSVEELIRLHDKRNWRLPDREIQWRIKAVRTEYYDRRAIAEICKRRVILTPDPDAALQDALRRMDAAQCLVVILPDAQTTLPKEHLFQCQP